MKMSLTNFRKTFIYLEYVIYSILLLLLMQLGLWQLHRADEKQAILKQYHQMMKRPEKIWQAGDIEPMAFQRILVEGSTLPLRFYLDNQFYEHRIGYDVLIPVQLADDSILLVDAGWVLASTDRQVLPRLKSALKKNNWRGQVYVPPMHPIQLGRFVDHQQNQLYVIESLDFSELEKILKHPIHHWVLRLNPENNSVFQRKWQIINVAPQRHKAYALQWFTMALVVVVIFLWRVIHHAKK